MMDSKEIHRAMKLRLPVECDGEKYERIEQYISWYDNAGRHQLSVRLVKNRSCRQVLADRVRIWEER